MPLLPPLPKARSTPALNAPGLSAKSLARGAAKQTKSVPSLPQLPGNVPLPSSRGQTSRGEQLYEQHVQHDQSLPQLARHYRDQQKGVEIIAPDKGVCYKVVPPQQDNPPASIFQKPTSYASACSEWHLIPKFARAVRDGLQEEELDLNGLGCGDTHLTALLCDSALVPAERIRRWRLQDDRLSSKGCRALVSVLPPCLELLDLARNRVGVRGLEALKHLMLRAFFTDLKTLNLAANDLCAGAVSSFIEGLANCPALVSLDLSRNRIQDGSALGKFVAGHKQLMHLSLHSNFLSGWGAEALFKGMLCNTQNHGLLASVDVAWNRMGFDAFSLKAALALADVLHESVMLYHLDLSYNGFNAQCCEEIAKGLRNNHLLYGLHFVGNAATMDADGFLLPLRNVAPQGQEGARSAIAFGDPRNGMDLCVGAKQHRCGIGPVADADKLRERDVLEHQTACWACEGWERVELVWPLEASVPEPRAVWAFTSLDGFHAALRLVRQTGHPHRFAAARMIPPGFELRVIFQVDAALRLPCSMSSEDLKHPMEIRLRSCEELPTLDPPDDQEVLIRTPTKVVLGCRHVGILGHRRHGPGDVQNSLPKESWPMAQRVVVVDGPDGGCPVQMCRVTEVEHKMKMPEPPFYAKYRYETENVARQCFEIDWSRAKVGRLVPGGDQDALCRLICKRYREIISLYRIASTAEANGESGFGVSQLEASRLMVNAGLGDDRLTKYADLDRMFIIAKVKQLDRDKAKEKVFDNEKAMNSKGSNILKGRVDKDNGLVRFQFLEFLLRSANQRFVETGRCKNLLDATKRVLDALVASDSVKQMDDFLEALHTKQVDSVFRAHEELLQEVYKRHSGRHSLQGHTFMGLDEFEELLGNIDAYDKEFPQRKAAFAFRMGMFTQPEEKYSSRFQEMNFVEFQHAIGACVFQRAGYTASRMAELLDEFITTRVTRAKAEPKKRAWAAARRMLPVLKVKNKE